MKKIEILKIISQQTFWQIIGKAVTSFSTIIILSLVARNYHEEGTGIFTLALTYLAMFNLLADFGFNAHVLKNIKCQIVSVEWQKLLGTRILWSILLAILAVLLFPFLPFSTVNLNQAVIFGSLGILTSAIFISCNLIFQSKLRYDLSSIAVSLGTLTGLITTWLLISNNLPVPYLLIGNSVSWIVIAAFALILVNKIHPKLLPIFDYQYTYNLFKKTWPVAATLALNVVYFRADSFIITFYKGLSDTAYYNVAYSIFQSVLVLPAFIMNAYYPLMLKSWATVKYATAALFGLAVLIMVMIYILAPFLILMIAGSRFASSSSSLQILSLSFPAFFLSSIAMWALVAKEKYRTMLLIYLAGLIFNLLLNFLFIPQYSYLAASWITVVSEYLILIMLAVSLIR